MVMCVYFGCVVRRAKLVHIYYSVQSSPLLMIDPDTPPQLSHLIARHFEVCDKLNILNSSFVTDQVFARNVHMAAMKTNKKEQ